MRNLTALLAGALFGFGLALARLTDPATILGFLDAAGDWDPTLGVVMAAALAVSAAAYRIAGRRARPLLAPRFELPTRTEIDRRLLGGAALFGVGWGLAGVCPGPAVAALVSGSPKAALYAGAMLVGLALARLAERGPAARLAQAARAG